MRFRRGFVRTLFLHLRSRELQIHTTSADATFRRRFGADVSTPFLTGRNIPPGGPVCSPEAGSWRHDRGHSTYRQPSGHARFRRSAARREHD
jgi:hypothetical protein